jgi:hypothetical protein
MRARCLFSFSCWVVIGLLTSACSTPEPTRAPRAKDFEADLAQLKRSDPESPAALTVQLSYAEFLLNGTQGPCAERLEHAQEELGSVDANPEARVMFPEGWPNVADLEYRVHLARAECTATDRNNELQAAVVAARRAVELYGNVFDYHSMVIMQFDAAVAMRQLGEDAAALKALEAALDMDREYGFKDDAPENYKWLLTWRGQPAGDEQVAALMRDFPQRKAVLKFGWRANDAQVSAESHRECLQDGQIVPSDAAATFERHVGPGENGGWNVSYSSRLSRYEPGVWPATRGSQAPVMVFAPALLAAAGFKVSAAGEFESVTDSESFAAQLATSTEKLIRAAAPAGARANQLTNEAVNTTTSLFTPGMLEAAAAENYQLETAMWIGATLDQGVWYQIDAPLSVAGMPRVVVQNRIEFAFTRRVPCTAQTTEKLCVEIVIRATPDKEALDRVMADFIDPDSESPIADYRSSRLTRIVTDPATLLPYAREQRVYWYASLGRGRTILESEHLVSRATYATE